MAHNGPRHPSHRDAAFSLKLWTASGLCPSCFAGFWMVGRSVRSRSGPSSLEPDAQPVIRTFLGHFGLVLEHLATEVGEY
jgi:hypothetical protein